MRMYLISDNNDTYTGMRLSGVEGTVVHTKAALKEQLDKVLADKTIGIVLITEKLSAEFPDIINDIKLNRRLPLIVEIPDRHGTGRKPDFITAYVNEAIGLKL
ncbi:MAG: Vacuolar H+transporting two-sector ATPase subunit [Herbinix sp.]|nr:Vacuolar H+transporting two-sector ATPase subunit [Herbinix sp.]